MIKESKEAVDGWREMETIYLSFLDLLVQKAVGHCQEWSHFLHGVNQSLGGFGRCHLPYLTRITRASSVSHGVFPPSCSYSWFTWLSAVKSPSVLSSPLNARRNNSNQQGPNGWNLHPLSGVLWVSPPLFYFNMQFLQHHDNLLLPLFRRSHGCMKKQQLLNSEFAPGANGKEKLVASYSTVVRGPHFTLYFFWVLSFF